MGVPFVLTEKCSYGQKPYYFALILSTIPIFLIVCICVCVCIIYLFIIKIFFNDFYFFSIIAGLQCSVNFLLYSIVTQLHTLFVFLGLYPWHMEVPRLGSSEL